MKFFFTLFLFVNFMNTINAQYDNCERWTMGFNFTLTNPIGEMRSNEFRTNYGFTTNALYKLNRRNNFLNFHIGLRLAVGRGFGERNDITLEIPEAATARSSVYNLLFDMDFLGRITTSKSRKTKIYFDIFSGIRFIGVKQNVRLKSKRNDYERKTSEQINESGNGAWGTGGGMLFYFVSIRSTPTLPPSRLMPTFAQKKYDYKSRKNVRLGTELA